MDGNRKQKQNLVECDAKINAMTIFLTFDYELFFGENSGSVEKCMIHPTNLLLDLAKKHGVPMTFFIDIGFVLALEKYKSDFPELESDYQKIVAQLERMKEAHCDIQLHIHPHWERSYYDGTRWIIVTKNCYKLSDFSSEERDSIVIRYKNRLDELRGSPSIAFRAGGWCIQPFSELQSIFKTVGIRIDSSVFAGGFFDGGEYNFDFRTAPTQSWYRFEDDVCNPEATGSFEEFAIGSHRYSPLFYWKLYIAGRLDPKNHKMIGDGIFLSQPGRKKHVLTSFTQNHVSTDGFYASKLQSCTENYLKRNEKYLVTIGHPKSCTYYSLRKLDAYLDKYRNRVTFLGFEKL